MARETGTSGRLHLCLPSKERRSKENEHGIVIHVQALTSNWNEQHQKARPNCRKECRETSKIPHKVFKYLSTWYWWRWHRTQVEDALPEFDEQDAEISCVKERVRELELMQKGKDAAIKQLQKDIESTQMEAQCVG